MKHKYPKLCSATLTLNPGLVLTSFQTTQPRLHEHELLIQSNLTSTWSAVNFRKHMTLMSFKPEPAIWSCDTGQLIPCVLDLSQLTITWMSNIKYICCKPRLHDLVIDRVWPLCCTILLPSSLGKHAHDPYCLHDRSRL